jgi:hypothetical protein
VTVGPKRSAPDESGFVREFDSLGAAEMVKALLAARGVESALEIFTVAGVPSRVRLYVSPLMVHRARWILTESDDVSERELAYLATGELDPEDEE